MKSRTRTAELSIIFLALALYFCSLEGKAIKRKHKHASHHKGSKRSGAFLLKCEDHKYCISYRPYDCNQFWVKSNCMKMCKICKSHESEALKLPAVLYYKHGDKRSEVPDSDGKDPVTRDVVFLSHMNDPQPTTAPATQSVSLFDYKGNLRNWQFLFPKEHPVYAHAEGAKTWGDQPSQTQPGAQDQAAATSAAPAAAASSVAPDAATAAVAPAVAAVAAAAAPAVAAAAPAVAAAAAAPAVTAATSAAPAAAASAAVPAVTAAPSVAPAVAAAYPSVTAAPSTAPAVDSSAASNTYAARAPAAPTVPPTVMPAVGALAPAASVKAPAQQYNSNAVSNQTQVAQINSQQPAVSAQPVVQAANSTAVQSPVTAAAASVPVTSPVAGNAVAQTPAAYDQSANPINTTQVSNQTAGVQQQGQTGDQTAGAQQVQQTQKSSDNQADCKECPKMTKPPVVLHPFTVYCEDKFPSCGVGYSACNDTWWQMNCPKRCGVCRPDSSNTSSESAQFTSENSQEGSKIYPNEVANFKLPEDKITSDLVAPSAGLKPSVAKYTLRVKPMFKNGVPQIQEIRILPPHNKIGYTKPLMILKQNITKPMIENIEIDVPKKGAHLSSKPSVEVIEGKHKEMLIVNKGQALLPDTSIQSETVQNSTNTTQPAQPQTTAAQAYDPAPAPYAAPEQASSQAAAYPQYPTAAVVTTQIIGLGRSDVATECSDHERCLTFPESMCAQHWVQRNCRKKCKICS